MAKLFVFPGQGSQYVGMGEDLFDKFPDVVALADGILGYSLRELCLEDGQERLNQTQYTQPALYTVSVLHYMDKMASGEDKPDFLAGHSLGEYAALYAAGAFDFETGLRLVKKRGELMAQAPKGAMAAVLKLSLEKVSALLSDSSFDQIELANINSDDQIVLSGDFDQVFAAASLFTDAGGRYFPLKVSAAFHSSLMSKVAGVFGQYLKGFTFSPLHTPVISNLTGRPYPKTDYLDLLEHQIDHSVKWYESMSWALLRDCDDIQEIGPGMVLTKLARTIKDKPMAISADEPNGPLQNIFMFGGQGCQYKDMGRELYANDELFRKHFDHLDGLVAAKTGFSMVAHLYHPRSAGTFDDVRISHPTLLCFQYALAQWLIEKGIEPDAVVGHSLGEYVAGVVAGSLSLDSAIDLVITQAALLHEQTAKGDMLVVLSSKDLLERNPGWFAGLHFAADNFNGSFVLSGEQKDIEASAKKLEQQQISHQVLGLGIAFHSPLIDAIERPFVDFVEGITFTPARIPVHSCCAVETTEWASAEHLWDVVRQPLSFATGVEPLLGAQSRFIDLSPTAGLSIFLKHGFNQEQQQVFLINQFGRDIQSSNKVLKLLEQDKNKVGAESISDSTN